MNSKKLLDNNAITTNHLVDDRGFDQQRADQEPHFLLITMINRPRNVLLTQGDIREPVQCKFQHSVGALRHSLTIHQTPEEDTWPGGALWDCGLLIAELLLAVAGVDSLTTIHTLLEEEGEGNGATMNSKSSSKSRKSNKQKSSNNTKNKNNECIRTTKQMSSRFHTWLQQSSTDAKIWKDQVEDVLLHRSNLTVVELGCGVGLTGLVASIALGAATTILTDLTVVVDKVTVPNLIENTTTITDSGRRKSSKSSSADSSTSSLPSKYYSRVIQHFKGGGKVVAMPLCWGVEGDGAKVLEVLKELQPPFNTGTASKGKGKKGAKKTASTRQETSSTNDAATPSTIYPDLILLGDVAYQHKPGAMSHFDILVESLRQLMPASNTDGSAISQKTQLLLFGIRLRMPASMDLLLQLREHFTPILQTPIPAQVLDPALEGIKHNMTIHVFTNKQASVGL